MSIAELEAQKAARLAEVAAEFDAKIAAAREPDWDAAIDAYFKAISQVWDFPIPMDRVDRAVMRAGFKAAAPLMPVNAMTEAEIEALTAEVTAQVWKSRFDMDLGPLLHQAAKLAIRATLARGPVAAPTEAEAPVTERPWIDWHGGECPVPAGTRVEVRFRDEATGEYEAAGLDWRWVHYRTPADIIAYRILSGAA